MPTIMRRAGYRFFFYASDDGEPPHVHVEREGKVAKVWLEPVRLQRHGGFAAHEVNRILALVKKYRMEMLESWHGFFGG